jgi:hypothetical protein
VAIGVAVGTGVAVGFGVATGVATGVAVGFGVGFTHFRESRPQLLSDGRELWSWSSRSARADFAASVATRQTAAMNVVFRLNTFLMVIFPPNILNVLAGEMT